jgi:hypothetical protein
MPLRAAAVCGLLVPVTVSVAYIGGALAQPDAYSSADDATSDLGALTANKAWISNQIGSNLTGILIILLGLGLWRALSPDVLGRIGAGRSDAHRSWDIRRCWLCPSCWPLAFSSASSATARRNAPQTSPCSSGSCS